MIYLNFWGAEKEVLYLVGYIKPRSNYYKWVRKEHKYIIHLNYVKEKTEKKKYNKIKQAK